MTGGRAAASRLQRFAGVLVARGVGAVRRHRGPRRRRSRRARRCGRRPRRAERVGQDDAAPRVAGLRRRRVGRRRRSPAGSRTARLGRRSSPTSHRIRRAHGRSSSSSLVHALWGAATARRAEVLLDGIWPRRPPRPKARNALPRPPAPGECGRRALARSAAARSSTRQPQRSTRRRSSSSRGRCGAARREDAASCSRPRTCISRARHATRSCCSTAGVVIDRGEPGALRARHGAASLEEVFLTALGDRALRERVRDAFDAL